MTEGERQKDANSLPIKQGFCVHRSRLKEGGRERRGGKKEPDFGIKRLKQKLPYPPPSVIASALWLLVTYLNNGNYISELMRERQGGKSRPRRDD